MDFTKMIQNLIDGDSREMDRIRKSATARFTPDRAHRFVQLYSRVDALTDILGLAKRKEREDADKLKLVVIAGPNQPETLTLEEISEVLAEFDTSECLFWVRQENGSGLEIVFANSVDTTYDDAFIYWLTEFRTTGHSGRLLGSCSWSRKRVTT